MIRLRCVRISILKDIMLLLIISFWVFLIGLCLFVLVILVVYVLVLLVVKGNDIV